MVAHGFNTIFFVKDIYLKTILPIYLVPYLKIFPMKNNIFLWKSREAELVLAKHADTHIKTCC
jgi:hypothetical protein